MMVSGMLFHGSNLEIYIYTSERFEATRTGMVVTVQSINIGRWSVYPHTSNPQEERFGSPCVF